MRTRTASRTAAHRALLTALLPAGALLMVAGLVATATPDWADPLFPQPFFEVGDLATGVAAADLNGDGIPDLVAGARRNYDGCAQVLIGGARSLLRPAACLPVGGDPVAFAVADFDRDGHADIAAGWSASVFPLGGGVVVNLGNGDGTFREASRFPAEGPVGDLAAGDFNGDGLQDLALIGVATGSTAPYAAVLPGRGDGTFGPAIWEKRGSQPLRLAVADFDGDGVSDLAVTDSGLWDVEIYLGRAGGTLVLRAAYSAGISPHQLASADFDGDGKIDLALVDRQDSAIRVYDGLGNGQFQSRPAVSLGEVPGEIAAGDFDGDGRADLAVARELARGIILMTGDGSGSLRRAGTADAVVGMMASADFDRDGLADLAATSGAGVAVLRSLDRFVFPGNLTLSEGPIVRGAYARDFNRDGREDLAVFYTYAAEIYVYPGRADGAFDPPAELDSDGFPPEILRSGDFNGDGNLDLVSVGSARALYFFGSGDGHFEPFRLAVLPDPVTEDVAVADLDGNGLDDLVVVAKNNFYLPYGYATVILSMPGGLFQVLPHWDAGHNPQGAALADFDGDGRPDLAITNIDQRNYEYAGTLSLFPGLGGGDFGPLRSIPLVGIVHGIASADLNGDAILDLVVADSSSADTPTSGLAVLLGIGGGTFAAEQRHAATGFPLFVQIRDMDADGALDLVTVGYFGGDVTVLRGDGHGSFAPQESYATHLSLQAITVGDFDGDGRPDLAQTNQNTSFTDGRLVVVPSRPPFPCLPAPGDEPGRCVQDAVEVRIDARTDLGRGAGLVSWRTTHEHDVLGFNLVEIDRSGNSIRLNRTPIRCVECATGGGTTYAFPVAKHKSGRDIFVELLRASGPPRIFGPARRQ